MQTKSEIHSIYIQRIGWSPYPSSTRAFPQPLARTSRYEGGTSFEHDVIRADVPLQGGVDLNSCGDGDVKHGRAVAGHRRPNHGAVTMSNLLKMCDIKNPRSGTIRYQICSRTSVIVGITIMIANRYWVTSYLFGVQLLTCSVTSDFCSRK